MFYWGTVVAFCVECGHNLAATFCAACGAKQPTVEQAMPQTGLAETSAPLDSPLRRSLPATIGNFTSSVLEPSFTEPVVMVFTRGDAPSEGLVSSLERLRTPGAQSWRLVTVDMDQQKEIVDVYAAPAPLPFDSSPVVFINWKSQGYLLFSGVPSQEETRDALVAFLKTIEAEAHTLAAASGPHLTLEDELKLAHRCKCGALVLPQAYQKPVCWNCGRTLVVVGCSDCSQWFIFDLRKPRAVSVQCGVCKQDYHYSKEEIAEYFTEATVPPSSFSIPCPQCRSIGLRLIWRQKRRTASVIPGTVIVTAFQGHYEYWKDAICPTCSYSFQFTQKSFGHDWPE